VPPSAAELDCGCHKQQRVVRGGRTPSSGVAVSAARQRRQQQRARLARRQREQREDGVAAALAVGRGAAPAVWWRTVLLVTMV
jgi:hypothetical protein